MRFSLKKRNKKQNKKNSDIIKETLTSSSDPKYILYQKAIQVLEFITNVSVDFF